MLRGELHNRGSAGRCEACGEIFPCPTGLDIYEAVKREFEHQEPAKCDACGHEWRWHTTGGMCQGTAEGIECHCVMIREHPTPRTPEPAAPRVQATVYAPRWEDLDDRADRCPQCLHWWVSHGSEPDPDGCGMLLSGMAERTAMAEEDRRLQREGVPPEVAGPCAYRELRHCGCQERPAPGSDWAKRLAREAAYQAEHYERR